MSFNFTSQICTTRAVGAIACFGVKRDCGYDVTKIILGIVLVMDMINIQNDYLEPH